MHFACHNIIYSPVPPSRCVLPWRNSNPCAMPCGNVLVGIRSNISCHLYWLLTWHFLSGWIEHWSDVPGSVLLPRQHWRLHCISLSSWDLQRYGWSLLCTSMHDLFCGLLLPWADSFEVTKADSTTLNDFRRWFFFLLFFYNSAIILKISNF